MHNKVNGVLASSNSLTTKDEFPSFVPLSTHTPLAQGYKLEEESNAFLENDQMLRGETSIAGQGSKGSN